MNLIDNSNLDCGILVCQKELCHQAYIELLFQNWSISGSGIKKINYDNLLKQFLLIYDNPNTVNNLMRFNAIYFDNRCFMPKRIDKTKFIVEYFDKELQIYEFLRSFLLNIMEIDLYGVVELGNNLIMIDCYQTIDFNKLKKINNYLNNPDSMLVHLVANDNRLSEVYDFKSFSESVRSESPNKHKLAKSPVLSNDQTLKKSQKRKSKNVRLSLKNKIYKILNKQNNNSMKGSTMLDFSPPNYRYNNDILPDTPVSNVSSNEDICCYRPSPPATNPPRLKTEPIKEKAPAPGLKIPISESDNSLHLIHRKLKEKIQETKRFIESEKLKAKKSSVQIRDYSELMHSSSILNDDTILYYNCDDESGVCGGREKHARIAAAESNTNKRISKLLSEIKGLIHILSSNENAETLTGNCPLYPLIYYTKTAESFRSNEFDSNESMDSASIDNDYDNLYDSCPSSESNDTDHIRISSFSPFI